MYQDIGDKMAIAQKRCLGCGIELEIGEVCYHCMNDGLTLTQIHNEYGKTEIIAPDGKKYAIWYH